MPNETRTIDERSQMIMLAIHTDRAELLEPVIKGIEVDGVVPECFFDPQFVTALLYKVQFFMEKKEELRVLGLTLKGHMEDLVDLSEDITGYLSDAETAINGIQRNVHEASKLLSKKGDSHAS